MNTKQKTRWWVDAVLFAGFIATFFLDLTGVELHQWLGIFGAALAALSPAVALGLGQRRHAALLWQDLGQGAPVLCDRCADADRLRCHHRHRPGHLHLAQPDPDQLHRLADRAYHRFHPHLAGAGVEAGLAQPLDCFRRPRRTRRPVAPACPPRGSAGACGRPDWSAGGSSWK